MAKKKYDASEELAAGLEATGVIEVVKVGSGSQVSAFFRVHDDKVWTRILEYVLVRKTDWNAHVCRQYFIRGGRLVYGWNFIVQVDGDPSAAVSEAVRLLMEGAKVVPKVSPAKGQVMSFPLVGASPRRTSGSIAFDPRLPGPSRGGPSHKGAYPVRTEE